MKKQNIEVEGGELLIQSKEGHYAVIPAKHRQEVMDMVKDGCDDCINAYIQTLPKEADYAPDGSLFPDWDKVKNKIKATLNPKNWGVPDYSDKGSRDAAYAAARKAGEKEFMWNNRRFNTKYDGTSEQQLKETGITDKQMLKSNIVRDRMEDNIYDFEYHTKNPITKMKNVVLDNEKEVDYLDIEGEIPENKKTHKDLLSLYLGKPQKYNTVSISKYKPSDSKEKDKEYFSINSKEFKDYVFKHLDEDYIAQGIRTGEIKPARDKNGKVIPNRYIIRDIGTGLGEFTIDRGKDENGEYISYWDKWDLNPYKGIYSGKDISNIEDLSFGIGKPYNIYDRLYFRDNPDKDKFKENAPLSSKISNKLLKHRNYYYTKRSKYIRQYYSDKELLELDINKKNFDTLALQRELRNRGYKLPKSTKKDGTLDGIWGEETKNALLDYQSKNKKN